MKLFPIRHKHITHYHSENYRKYKRLDEVENKYQKYYNIHIFNLKHFSENNK